MNKSLEPQKNPFKRVVGVCWFEAEFEYLDGRPPRGKVSAKSCARLLFWATRIGLLVTVRVQCLGGMGSSRIRVIL